jgi:type 1 fimbria pilin
MKQTQLAKAIGAMALGGALLLTGASAFAADSADLTVKGNITPSACSPVFEGGGVVDFGTVKADALKANDYTKLTDKTVNLTVTCPTAKYVKFSVVDNQKTSSLGAAVQPTLGSASTNAANYVYGLGTTSIDGQSVNLGSYALSVNTAPTVDGSAAAGFGSQTTGGNLLGTWDKSAYWIVGDGSREYTAINAGLLGVLPPSGNSGKVFVFPITVTAAINKGSLLPVTEDVKLNGQATFQLVYQ